MSLPMPLEPPGNARRLFCNILLCKYNYVMKSLSRRPAAFLGQFDWRGKSNRFGWPEKLSFNGRAVHRHEATACNCRGVQLRQVSRRSQRDKKRTPTATCLTAAEPDRLS